jgi:hypothetical protein
MKDCHIGEIVLIYSAKTLCRRHKAVIVIWSILILGTFINAYSMMIWLFRAIKGMSTEWIVRLDPYFIRILYVPLIVWLAELIA